MAHRGDIQAFWLDAEWLLMHPSSWAASTAHNLSVNTSEISCMSVGLQRESSSFMSPHSGIQNRGRGGASLISDQCDRRMICVGEKARRTHYNFVVLAMNTSDFFTRVPRRVRPRENRRPQLHLVRKRFRIFVVVSLRSRLKLHPRSFEVTRHFRLNTELLSFKGET